MNVELSVVIPVYNSQDNLVELINQLKTALSNFTYEIILINDNSKDNSWQVIQEICTQNTNVLGLNLNKNFGQDNAIMSGLNQVKGQYIVIMDDDLQHSPFDIVKLYEACLGGLDICFANFETKKHAKWKNFGSWLNGKTAQILLQKPSEIYLSPFKIIRRSIVDEIIKYKGPYPYVDGLLLRVTSFIGQIPLEHHSRYKGKSNFNFVKSLKVYLKLATTFSVIPLRISAFFGLCFAIFGFLLIPYYLFDYFFNNNVVEGWISLMIIELTIGGLVLTSLGIIGEYLGRMYLSVNDKPQFVIREKVYKG